MSRRAGLVVAAVVAAIVAILAGVLGGHGGPGCDHARAPQGAGSAWLPEALAAVPCPGGPGPGDARYGLQDDRGAPMDVLDPIADPRGGYLGVYHVPDGAAGKRSKRFELLLAHSDDLIHWHRLRVLEAGASMPTLRPVPGSAGFLLADERGGRRDTGELHWYPSLDAVLHGSPARSIQLPLRFSHANNGTPAFVAIAWHGSLSRSRVTLSFHYQSAAGPDREAFGLLSGFHRWSAQRDTRADALLDREGFAGSHGDERWFAYAGQNWRILEAQSRPDSFASWQVLLYQPSARRFETVRFATERGRLATAIGNPTAQVLPGPGGHGQVLVVTAFVFRGAPLGGELLFLRPAR